MPIHGHGFTIEETDSFTEECFRLTLDGREFLLHARSAKQLADGLTLAYTTWLERAKREFPDIEQYLP